jgi:predicted amidohydrolase
MYQTLEVAAISFVPVKFDLEDNAARLEAAFRKAARGGAQLALAPEGILEGYVTNEIIRKEVPASRMRDVAVQINGPEIGRFRRLARELDMCLAFGCAEQIEDEVFNCAIFIDHRGKLRGNYHKMQLAEGYHKSWWYNRIGSSSRAVATPYGKCGFLICNDRWNPLLARVPVLDGARFLLIPSYGSRSKKQDRAVLARARENGVPIVEANVGVTLIISKGEIVKVSRKEDTVTFGTIEIPAPPSSRNRDRQEEVFLENRRENLPRLNRKRLEMLRQARK